jgi:hypothetical protein
MRAALRRERLYNVYIPRWLATQGMGAEKIAAFYADPVRAAYHAHSAHKAFLIRSVTIDTGARLGGAPLGRTPEARRDRDAARAGTAGEAKRASVRRGETSRALARSTTRR